MEADLHVDADRLKYLAWVLEGYFRWSRGGDPLGFAETYRVMGIATAVEDRRLVDLSDDEFTLLDRAYARLHELQQKIIRTEYRHTGSPLQKAHAMGYAGQNSGAVIGSYGRDLKIAQSDLWFLLMPHIEDWESAKPMRRKSR
jgi:hypothetical protein